MEKLYFILLLFICSQLNSMETQVGKIVPTRPGQLCLHTACDNNDIGAVKSLLGKKCINVNQFDDYGVTPLQHAVIKSDSAIVALLLYHGAHVNHADDFGNTALTIACYNNKWLVLDVLLAQKEIDINQGKREKPLFFAARHSSELLNSFLNSEKVTLHEMNENGQTWFHIAWFSGVLSPRVGYKHKSTSDMNTVDILADCDEEEQRKFLEDELRLLPGMHSLLGDKEDLKNFIQFCMRSGQGARLVYNACNICNELEKLFSGSNEESSVKKMVLNAFKISIQKQEI